MARGKPAITAAFSGGLPMTRPIETSRDLMLPFASDEALRRKRFLLPLGRRRRRLVLLSPSLLVVGFRLGCAVALAPDRPVQ
jgi:hypothetical protein